MGDNENIYTYIYIYKSHYRYFFDNTVKSITRGINSGVVNGSCDVGRVPGEVGRAEEGRSVHRIFRAIQQKMGHSLGTRTDFAIRRVHAASFK